MLMGPVGIASAPIRVIRIRVDTLEREDGLMIRPGTLGALLDRLGWQAGPRGSERKWPRLAAPGTERGRVHLFPRASRRWKPGVRHPFLGVAVDRPFFASFVIHSHGRTFSAAEFIGPRAVLLEI